MKPLTNRAKQVVNKEMTFSEKIYLPAVLGGLKTTMSHFFKKQATVRYPEEVRPFSDVFRGKHVLKRDESGAERCTACGLCAVACPAEAITMVAAERKKGEESLYREEKYAETYEINMLRCIFLRNVRRSLSERSHFPHYRNYPCQLRSFEFHLWKR